MTYGAHHLHELFLSKELFIKKIKSTKTNSHQYHNFEDSL